MSIINPLNILVIAITKENLYQLKLRFFIMAKNTKLLSMRKHIGYYHMMRR